MEMTAKSLRNRIGEALACVDRGDSVVITYRGKPKARIVAFEDADQGSTEIDESGAFGMWADREDMRDVGEYVRRLRAPRYAR